MVDESIVVEGNPGDSDLFVAMTRGRMPPRNQAGLPRPTPEEVEVIREWITEGAPSFPLPKRRTFISLDAQMKSIFEHYRGLGVEDKKNVRYFTMANLWNDPGCDDRHLRMTRASLAKALNSLSWESELVIPKPVNPEETIFAVDISKLGWSQEHWAALLAEYPYQIATESLVSEGDGEAIRELRQIDAIMAQQSNDRSLKHIRIDWLVTVGLRPKLYHKLLYELKIPSLVMRDDDLSQPNNPKKMTDRDLEEFLRVSVQDNIFKSPVRARRSGYNESGISGQNRMIERHPRGDRGYYWKSYDFLASNSRAILTEFPLGPRRSSDDEFTFLHDGGEIIFDLPNGLQGYLLATGAGDRLDAGPIEIVGDALKTSGNQLIVNGLSCVVCHRRGIVEPPNDEVRSSAGFFGAIADQIRDLYPEPSEMRNLVEGDTNAFSTVVEKLVGQFLLVGEDASVEIDSLPEPVGEVSRRYLLEPINLETVGAELFHRDSSLLKILIERDNRVRRIGLGQLRSENGTIKRDAWHNLEGRSLMQQAAEVLGYAPQDANR
jgi:serine/threonine-protein kinase